jgi:hypothetical protein
MKNQCESCQLGEMQHLHVLQIDSGRHVLIVEGVKRYINASVHLVPMMYITTPGYWRIEVVECHGPVWLPALADYAICLMLDNYIGSRGIEVVDCKSSRKIDINPTQPGVE